MKLLIKHHDNDFYMTYMGILNLLKDQHDLGKDLGKLSKDDICLLINELVYPCYLLIQGSIFREDGSNSHIKEYLQITTDMILTNNEVTEYLKENQWDNGETFILDTDVVPSYVYTI